MLNLIKNLKVGTKLILILAPPVIVLIVLSVLGFQQRSADADEARRVDDLAQFASYTSRLSHALELEGLATAEFRAGPEGDPELAAKLEERRAATDAARQEYLDAVDRVDPAQVNSSEPDTTLRQNLETVENRLNQLSTVRTSASSLSNSPPTAIKDITGITEDLVQVNVRLAAATNDPELSSGLRSFANLGRLKSSMATEAAYLTLPAFLGNYYEWTRPTEREVCGLEEGLTPLAASLSGGCEVVLRVSDARVKITANTAVFEGDATSRQRQILRDEEANQAYRTMATGLFEAADDEDPAGAISDALEGDAEYMASAISALEDLHNAENKISAATQEEASVKASDATREANLYLVGSAAAIAIALILAFFVFRATTIPLRKLTSAAYTLSTDRLPALVDRLRNPESDSEETLAETLTPIDIDSKDEIGQLADAFNSIQHVTVEVAEEQAALLRKGIGDIFINLARRNQTLLDRQIEFIDQLESNEEDPDQLDNLFKLDHLATRMRRNAESLLVLAGAEPPRRRGRPVALADVVRVAIGEVEDFARIQLLSLDEATVGGNVAVDLAHLLSELMENATHFSPPDTMVEIVGHRSDNGYVLSVSDQGIGMSADQLAEANEQLAKPPLVGLALSRSLGFIVIGRLAARFDVDVRLTASPSGGVTAMVTLPRDVVTFADDVEEPTSGQDTITLDEPEDDLVLVDDDELVADLLDPATEVAPDEDFERSLESLRSDDLPEAPVEPEVPVITPPTERIVEPEPEPASPEPEVVEEPVVEAPRVETPPTPAGPPAADAEPEVAPLTAAGLVKRTPKQRAANATGGTMPGTEGAAPMPSRQSARSPEEIRKMLSRYRSGLNKGRAGADADGGGE